MTEENLVPSQELEAPGCWAHWANGLDTDWWHRLWSRIPRSLRLGSPTLKVCLVESE